MNIVTGEEQWLTDRRNAGATPAEITTELVASGWNADVAAPWALRSLRSSDHHRILYSAAPWTAGLSALSGAMAVHLALDGNPRPIALALAMTWCIALAPIAVWCIRAMGRLERTSRHAVWSPARRQWFATLAFCTAAIGIVRLLTFVYRVAASITGASARALTVASFVQVGVTIAVALPLFWWSMTEWRRSALLVSGLEDGVTDGRD